MSLLAKIFIVIQAMLVMAFLGLTATLYQHRRDWRTSYMKLKNRYSQLASRGKKEIDALRHFVRAKNDLIAAKEVEVRSLKNQVDAAIREATTRGADKRKLQGDLQNEKNRADNFSAAVTSLTSDRDKLREDNGRLKQAKDIATVRMGVAEAQVARLSNLVQALENDLGSVRRDFADTRKKLRDKELLIGMVEAAGVNIATLLPGPPVPRIDAQVLAVKKDITPHLVLLSVGADDQVQTGFEFSIYRAEGAGKAKYIGKVVVERVMKDAAGCRVLYTDEGQEVQSGDKAQTRLSN